MTESANVEGARVLTTIGVPRAVCLAKWVLDRGLRSASSHPYARRLCAHQRQSGYQLPIPWVRALSYMVRSMVSIICSFWLGGSNEVSSTQWGMHAPPLYYRSCVSDGVLHSSALWCVSQHHEW